MLSLTWFHVFIFFVIVMLGTWVAKRSHSDMLLFFVSIFMICVAGLRHGYIDTRSYRHGFENLEISEILNLDFILFGEGKDRGFSVLTALIKCLTDDSQIYLFILSLITVGLLFWGIVKRVPEVDFGVFLFVTTGLYLDTMNGVRQVLVAAILFYFLPQFVEKNKIIQYIVLVLIMSTVHGTAILFIPLYFFMNKKPWSIYTWLIIAVGIFSYVFFNSGVSNFIIEILDGTTYGNDYGTLLEEGNTSVNVLRIVIAAVPIALSFLARNMKVKNFTMYNIAFNMSVFNFFTWILANRVLYFYRLAIYFAPYMILLLCYEIGFIRDIKNRKVIHMAAIICYLIFFVYTLYVMDTLFFVGYLNY